VATVGYVGCRPVLCGLHLEGKTMNDEQQTQQADDPSGPGWRDVGPKERIEQGDVYICSGVGWLESDAIGRLPSEFPNLRYRRRIEQQQPSDSEPETMEQLRKRLDAAVRQNVELADRLANEQNKKGAYERIAKASVSRAQEAEALVAQADRGGQQVNAELQQLREQVQTLTTERDEHARKLGFARECAEMSRQQVADEAGKVEQLKEQVTTLTRERDRYRNQLAGAIEHSSAAEAQAQLVDRLQAWLRPVLEVVADHPDHSSILAVSVLEFLPQIASRLIEE